MPILFMVLLGAPWQAAEKSPRREETALHAEGVLHPTLSSIASFSRFARAYVTRITSFRTATEFY
jgi:hypothetical protein